MAHMMKTEGFLKFSEQTAMGGILQGWCWHDWKQSKWHWEDLNLQADGWHKLICSEQNI